MGFNQFARSEGFNLGLQCSQDSMIAALTGIWLEKDLFEYAVTSLFCQDEEKRKHFSRIYKRFWLEKGSRIQSSTKYKNQKQILKSSKTTVVMTALETSVKNGNFEEGKTTSGANKTDTLKGTDFSQLNTEESVLLDALAEKLVREMSLRIKRRSKKANRGKVDIRDSIRKNMQRGGNILDLFYTKKKREQFRLLILLDVSGSMDKYSYYLLKFLWSLRNHFKHIEVFAFSTILLRITEQLNDKDIAVALNNVSRFANHWSSGTKIGECLQSFNDNFAQRYLNGKTLTLILSDGLETGDTEVLQEAIRKIKSRSKKLVWLNPLKGMEGYQPIQSGIKTVMPELNHFGSAHNLNSLLELEEILINA